MKLSELYYLCHKKRFFNRSTLHSHVGADVSIFSAAKCFPPNHVNLYIFGTAIQCWSKFPWELWSKNVRFPSYKGSKSTMTSSFFRGIFLFFLTYINLHTVGTAIYCWAKFPWEPWSKSVWFSRYKGSDQWWRHHISNGCS